MNDIPTALRSLARQDQFLDVVDRDTATARFHRHLKLRPLGEAAVVAVLAPICVAKFQQQTHAAAKLVAFNKISSSWDRRSLIEKGGWATMPGSNTPNSAVASACAEKLGRL